MQDVGLQESLCDENDFKMVTGDHFENHLCKWI